MGAILSRSVVMVASMDAWDWGADEDAGGAFEVEYLRAGRNERFAAGSRPFNELNGPLALESVRTIMPDMS